MRESSRLRRGAILEAALALYERGGDEAVTIEHIGDRSGASVGSIYHHFGGKEEILAALYLDSLERYRESLRAQLRGAVTAEEHVKTLVRHYLGWVEANPTRSRLLLRERHSAALRAHDQELRQSTLSLIAELGQKLNDAVARGEMLRLPWALYQPVLLGPTIELCRQWLSQRSGGLPPLEAADALADAAWRSVQSQAYGNSSLPVRPADDTP